MPVTVTLRYFGRFVDSAGTADEKLTVDTDIGRAYETIAGHLAGKYGIRPPFNLIVNDRHLMGAIKAGMKLKDGDVIHLLPFMSGG